VKEELERLWKWSWPILRYCQSVAETDIQAEIGARYHPNTSVEPVLEASVKVKWLVLVAEGVPARFVSSVGVFPQSSKTNLCPPVLNRRVESCTRIKYKCSPNAFFITLT